MTHRLFVSPLILSALLLGGCSSFGTSEPVGDAEQALGGACANVTFTVDPITSEVIGKPVDLTASAACLNPEYLFWVKDPTGTWTSVCGSDYQASGQCQWDTTGLAPGAYDLQGWARTVGGSDVEGANYVTNFTLATSGSCQPVALAVTPTGGANAGQHVMLGGSAPCTAGGSDYEFWVETHDGWTDPWGGNPSNTTCDWDTTGLPQANDYNIQVWARTHGDSPAAGYTSAAFVTPSYTLGPPASCDAVTLTTDPPQGAVDEHITLIGDATCAAGTPEYIFYVRTANGWAAPGGGYSTSRTCDGATTGLPPGHDYEIQVWTRAVGTTLALGYDSVAILGSYALGPTPVCGSVTLSTSPSTSAPVGSVVTLTGDAACSSGSAEYVFWVDTPGGWVAPCGDYSTNPTCDWDTTGLADGGYDIQVWTRAHGARPAAGYDSVAILAGYELGGGACGCPLGTKRCGGSCVSVDDPLYGCGAAACTPCSFSHGLAACDASHACVISICEPGWSDCDGNPSNGCEADLRSPTTCGSCGNSCSGQKCSQGSCVAACTPPLTDCSGECVNLATDADHCGGCTAPCAQPTAGRFMKCSGGSCTADVCQPGYTACDSTINGCINLQDSIANCGACGANSCAVNSEGLAGCIAGACMPCEAGFTASSGTCIDTDNDANNCGSCGHTCADSCANGACVAESSFQIVGGLSNGVGLAVDDEAVYWADAGSGLVNKSGKSGENVTTLASGAAQISGFATDATNVYWSDKLGAAVMAVAKTGGAPWLVSAGNTPRNLFVRDGYAYWIDADLSVYRAPTSGAGPATLLVTNTTTQFGQPLPLTLHAVDANNVYVSYVYQPGVHSYAFYYYVPTTGGTLTNIAPLTCQFGGALVATNTELYFSCDANFIPTSLGVYDKQLPNPNLLWSTRVDGSMADSRSLFVDPLNIFIGGGGCVAPFAPTLLVELSQCSTPSQAVVQSRRANLSTTYEQVVADQTSVYWLSSEGWIGKAPRL